MKKLLLFILMFSGVLCGLLQSSLSFPPLAFVSFAPVMYSLQKAKRKADHLRAFLGFFLPYYLTQTVFLISAYKNAPMSAFAALPLLVLAVILLTLWLSILMFIPVYILRWLKRSPLTDMAVIAALIAAGEWIQGNTPFLAFPWSSVSVTVTDSPLLMQISNLFGSRFLSFVILLTNGLIAQLFTQKQRVRTALMLTALQGANIAYGFYSVKSFEKLLENQNKIKVMCVQDDAEGKEKNDIPPYNACRSYLEIMQNDIKDDTTLVILPETPLLEGYNEDLTEFRYMQNFATWNKTTVISGCFLREDKNYNSQYAISPDGKISNFYCKQILVPFGEHDPFAFFTGESTLSPCTEKDKIKPIQTDEYKIGCGICIESIFPEILREHTKNGANVLCVSTNDSWFGKSGARVQHYRHSILRAAENGKYLVRAGNCGISAVIEPTGKPAAENFARNKGTISAEISLIDKRTLYSKLGEIFIIFPAILAVRALIRRFKH